MSNLYEKSHRGVLTGAALTDTKITLIAGRAHLKHTDGGDFREAALRAVRNGLMRAGCLLLEPYYKFRLEIPNVSVGRAMSDLQMRSAEFEIESSSEDITVICGKAPVSEIHDYTHEIISYTGGKGRLSCIPDGYEPCHNQDEIVEKCAYDPEADLENTPHSVFCAHGAGFIVPWNEVDRYKHIDAGISLSDTAEAIIPRVSGLARKYNISSEELEAIMLREFGPIKRRKYSEPKSVSFDRSEKRTLRSSVSPQKRMIIIDGYNVIHSWENLREIAEYSLEKAREVLMNILSNYVAFTKTEVTLVFDAYLVEDGMGSDFMHDGYRVVFTKQNQTADTFIDMMMRELGPNYNIRVVTGDRLIQYSAVNWGIIRMTTQEFEEEVTKVGNEINDFLRKLEETQK